MALSNLSDSAILETSNYINREYMYVKIKDIKPQLIEEIHQIATNFFLMKTYNKKYSEIWAHELADLIISKMKEKNPFFKYLVTCTILGKGKANLHLSTSCFWNNDLDDSLAVNLEFPTLYCMIIAFGLSI